MKRFLSIILATLMVLALVSFAPPEEARAEPEIWDGTTATSYAGGDGSEDDPFQIANGAQLAYLAQQANANASNTYGKYFKLTADIVLNDTSNWESWGSLDANDEIIAPANAWTPIGVWEVYFRGNFDGNYKTVSGIYINGGDNLGLFAACYGATIQNVGIAESFISGSFSVGGVVGSTHFNSTVTNCFNAGTVSGTGDNVGGVVGVHSKSTLTSCFNSGTVSGGSYVGGVVGFSAASVTNCYNSGTVSGNNQVGGIIGENFSSINTCYNVGNIIGEGTVMGGVVGINWDTVSNCYYLDTCGAAAGIGESEGGTVDNVISLTDEQLKDESYYGGFDFTNIWTMEGDPDYPYAEIRGWYVIPVSGITATESMELGIGGTDTIEYTITPSDAGNQNVSFTSSAESVATVSDAGVVTGVSAGTATITTTTEDGAFTDTTTVTVHADCTVTYLADGETVAQYQVRWNETLETIPDVPAKEGHDQVAPTWETDLTDVAIKQDYTINAVYTINTYTVTYLADRVQVAQYTVNWGEKLTEIPAIPTKPHHITVGWDKDLLNLAIKQDYEVTAQYTALLYGDANCDNEVDANDASLILRHVVGLSDISELGCIQGDVTPRYDHIPNSGDAAAILRLIVKLIPTFPIQNGN
ncbi:MAG: Ig-like domain-containing protein [Clostridia bacterium]|nr:Ig-like domain-containing protein [Clostridia bacterium]